MIDKTTIDRLIELGAQKPHISTPSDDGIPFVTIPIGMNVQSLLPFMPLHHINRHVALDDVTSFCEYVNRFDNDDGESTLIFCQATPNGAKFKAILDYHLSVGVSKPAFCDHVATYATQPTPEWTLWMANDRKPKPQEEFATFLEENEYLFKQPSGAELLELVSTLFAKSGATYDGALRLKSGGVTLHYDETVEVRGTMVGKPGELELPPLITAGISPFIGAPLYQVDARLKYSLANHKLSLRYETVTPHVIIRDSIQLLVAKVTELTEIAPLMGQT